MVRWHCYDMEKLQQIKHLEGTRLGKTIQPPSPYSGTHLESFVSIMNKCKKEEKKVFLYFITVIGTPLVLLSYQ